MRAVFAGKVTGWPPPLPEADRSSLDGPKRYFKFWSGTEQTGVSGRNYLFRHAEDDETRSRALADPPSALP